MWLGGRGGGGAFGLMGVFPFRLSLFKKKVFGVRESKVEVTKVVSLAVQYRYKLFHLTHLYRVESSVWTGPFPIIGVSGYFSILPRFYRNSCTECNQCKL